MKTVIMKIFEIDELSENIQEKIIANWRKNDDFFWLDDWKETLEAFFQYLEGDVILRDWSWSDYHGGYIRFEICENLRHMTGKRLFKYLINNYGDLLKKWDDTPLTGYCGDYDIMKPLGEFMARPRISLNLHDLIQDCFESWCKGLQGDYDHWQSPEGILEDIEANQITFTEKGEVFYA